MKFAFITTINSTKEISSKGDIDFCLAPFALRSETYKNYFINNKRYIIFDNGVAESDLIPNDIMVKLAIEMKVSEIIIPDKIGDYKTTKLMRESFLEKYYKLLKNNNIKIQSVIQGSTWDEYIKNLQELEQDKRINVIGIPFRMNYKDDFFDLIKVKEMRHSMKRNNFIKENNFKKEVHLLGCNLPIEMQMYKNSTKIRSMDSKLIARYAYNDINLNFQDIIKPKKKLFLDNVLSRKQINKAKLMIKKMKGGNK